jgi:hypothetical protein
MGTSSVARRMSSEQEEGRHLLRGQQAHGVLIEGAVALVALDGGEGAVAVVAPAGSRP